MGSDLNQPWVREQYLSEQVRKIEKENAELRERVEKAERERDATKLEVVELRAVRVDLLRALARAEVQADHSAACAHAEPVELTRIAEVLMASTFRAAESALTRVLAAEAERDVLRKRVEAIEGQTGALGAKLIRDLRARLARYEAPGPALLTAEHDGDCFFVECAKCCEEGAAPGDCDCTKSIREASYREQHARCVAVVERELEKSAATVQQQPTPYWRGGEDAVRNVLAALTGEAP